MPNMNGTRGPNGQLAMLESAEMQVVTGSVVTHTIHHHFQQAPDFMVMVYKCKIDSDGYVAGQEVLRNSTGEFSTIFGLITFVGSPGLAKAFIGASNRLPGPDGTTVIAPTASRWKTQLRAFWFTRTDQL